MKANEQGRIETRKESESRGECIEANRGERERARDIETSINETERKGGQKGGQRRKRHGDTWEENHGIKEKREKLEGEKTCYLPHRW